MKALLVRPPLNKNITTVKNFLFGEPMGIECVSAILKEQGVETHLVDFMLEERLTIRQVLEEYRPDIVGVTSQCTDVLNVLEIAREAKAFDPSITVLIGGVQATCFADSFFKDEVDYVFRSTTRANVAKLLDVIGRGNPAERLDGIYSKSLGFENDGLFCLNEYIVPDRKSTARYRKDYNYVGFRPCAVLQTAYGCRNRCTFCVRWRLEGDMLQEEPIDQIVQQIADIEEPYIMICDNDFLINAQRLEAFCDLVEKRGIYKEYICYGSVNSILEKPELLKRLHKNGLSAVIVGFEAFDDDRLQEYNKAATVDENLRAKQMLVDAGIACWGSFILHPDWSKEDFRKLLRYIKKLKPELLSFSPLVPHPLTPLYDQYRDRLLYPMEDYEKWNFGDVLVMPSKMTLHEYYGQVIRLAIRINTNLHALRYTLRAFPLKNITKLVLGFDNFFGVYIKNYRNSKVKP